MTSPYVVVEPTSLNGGKDRVLGWRLIGCCPGVNGYRVLVLAPRLLDCVTEEAGGFKYLVLVSCPRSPVAGRVCVRVSRLGSSVVIPLVVSGKRSVVTESTSPTPCPRS